MIQSEDEKSLHTRNTRCNATQATHWPQENTKFVSSESNSRSFPGKGQVSVRYGFQKGYYITI